MLSTSSVAEPILMSLSIAFTQPTFQRIFEPPAYRQVNTDKFGSQGNKLISE